MRLFLGILVDKGIDFLGHHTFEATFQQHTGRWLQTVLNQQGVDGQVTGDIPTLLDTVLTAGKVRQGAMQRLVSQHKLGLVE